MFEGGLQLCNLKAIEMRLIVDIYFECYNKEFIQIEFDSPITRRQSTKGLSIMLNL